MRIIAGNARGRIIKMPNGTKTRPTQDRVRESIFNIIREIVPGARVLDLYAGSGAFGIEALSRGASFAAFVDNNQECARTIRANLQVVGEDKGLSSVIRMDTSLAVSLLKKKKELFDIVFLDPPYHKGLAKNCLIKLSPCDILSEHSFIIVEHFKKDVLPADIGDIARFRESSHGDTIVSFYKKT